MNTKQKMVRHLYLVPKPDDEIISQREYQSIERLSYFLDYSLPVPGTKYRIGFDPLIGLIPGIGDFIGAILSVYIIGFAINEKVNRATVMRMTLNLAMDTLLGMFPLVGDFFDFSFRSNRKNIHLLKRALTSQRSQTKDFFFLIFIFLILFGIIFLSLFLTFKFLNFIVNTIF